MIDLIRSALTMLGLFTALTGVLYPVVVTGLAQTLFPHRAGGSLIERDGRVVGSELIGQAFVSEGYFWGRPSATSARPYDSAASTGSNLGPNNPALVDRVKGTLEQLRAAHPQAGSSVPVDLVTTSGSGLDPHITPAAAYFQVARVASRRNLDAAKVRSLVERQVEGRTFALLGEPRVNVLQLNLALDAMTGHDGKDALGTNSDN